MGSERWALPSGLVRREAQTIFLRAPSGDWAALRKGYKTEFRLPVRPLRAKRLQVPTPVVIYATARTGPKTMLMRLVGHAEERLLDIADKPDSLVREGMPTYDHFRTYWRRRTHRPYRPLDKVEVFTLAPWVRNQPAVLDQLGRALLVRLYGEYMEDR